jgi:hypothetical protein
MQTPIIKFPSVSFADDLLRAFFELRQSLAAQRDDNDNDAELSPQDPDPENPKMLCPRCNREITKIAIIAEEPEDATGMAAKGFLSIDTAPNPLTAFSWKADIAANAEGPEGAEEATAQYVLWICTADHITTFKWKQRPGQPLRFNAKIDNNPGPSMIARLLFPSEEDSLPCEQPRAT